MKAVICTNYGPPEVLQIKEVEKPSPKSSEVLIKNIAITVHIGDTKVRRLAPGFGPVIDFFFKPMMRLQLGVIRPRKKILGMELAGEIEAVGRDVKLFKKGDPVFASTEFQFGAYAEYVCMKENRILALKPSNLSFEEAAAVPNGALTALLHFRKANVQKGQKVLIYGASGSIGTFAVQLAKYFGAEVTGVCSTTNLEMVQAIGADKVIDYKKEDFTEQGETYHVIFDTVGKIPSKKRKKSLTQSGVFLNALSLSDNFKLQTEDLVYLKDLCESRALKPVIDRKYTIDEIVEAHRYVEKGHKKGNVVITF